MNDTRIDMITTAQQKRMYGLLRQTEETAYKDDYIWQASHERTVKSSELTENEAHFLLNTILEVLKGERMPINTHSSLYKNFKYMPHLGLQTPPAPENRNSQVNHLRRKVLAYCHKLGWYARNNNGDMIMKNGKPVLDYKGIDAYCKKYGKQHKPLNAHNEAELAGNGGLIWQFRTLTENTIQK